MSYTISRRRVPITGATAGSNAVDAVQSCDDSETTSRTNASLVPTDVDVDGMPIKHAQPDKRPVAIPFDGAWMLLIFSLAIATGDEAGHPEQGALRFCLRKVRDGKAGGLSIGAGRIHGVIDRTMSLEYFKYLTVGHA